MNHELEMIRKEPVLAHVEVLSLHKPGLKRITENLNELRRCPGRDTNHAPAGYKSGAVQSVQTCWVAIYRLTYHSMLCCLATDLYNV
jgi:hypothetical protein